MSKLQELLKLNKDIELLEIYGKFKSASILHEKFIKKSQIKPVSYSTEDRGFTYEKYFNDKLRKLQNAQNKDLVISEIRSDGFLKEEDKQQIINAISNSEKSAPIGQLSQQVQQEQNSQQESLNSVKRPLIPLPQDQQRKSPIQNLTDTANQNAAMETLYSQVQSQSPNAATPAEPSAEQAGLAPLVSKPQLPQLQVADPSQYLFSNLLNEAKEYLAINDFNNSAIIRDKAMQSNLTQEQKKAWMQEYNILVQNFSGSKLQGGYYSNQQNAINNIVKATQDLGIPFNEQSIAENEKSIINWFRNPEGPRADNSTLQLLRQISLSAYYNQQNKTQTPRA